MKNQQVQQQIGSTSLSDRFRALRQPILPREDLTEGNKIDSNLLRAYLKMREFDLSMDNYNYDNSDPAIIHTTRGSKTIRGLLAATHLDLVTRQIQGHQGQELQWRTRP